MYFSFSSRLKHFLIKSRYKRWLFPLVTSVPYFASLFWLVSQGQTWIAQLLLSPLFMILILGGVTIALASAEFRR